MVDIAGIKTYRTFGGKRFRFADQTINKKVWQLKKRELRSAGHHVRTHVVQMPIHTKYQLYVRRPCDAENAMFLWAYLSSPPDVQAEIGAKVKTTIDEVWKA